jgi:hypothetical protein
MFLAETHKGSKRLTRFSSEPAQYSTFSGKINDLEETSAARAIIAGIRVKFEADPFERFRTN